MRKLIIDIHKILLRSHKTVATAESCTGGLVSKTFTDNPESSKYFILGVAAYSNLAKTRILKIPAKLIMKKGAVSKEVAKEMAKSIRKIAKSDYGIGITGIAGPSGATPHKPLGTVFIAISRNKKTICKKFLFCGNRLSIRNKACFNSLKLLKSSF